MKKSIKTRNRLWHVEYTVWYTREGKDHYQYGGRDVQVYMYGPTIEEAIAAHWDSEHPGEYVPEFRYREGNKIYAQGIGLGTGGYSMFFVILD